MPCASGQGHEVNDRVGAAAHRHGAGDAVVEACAVKHIGGGQVLPHHLHDAAAALGAHADVVGIGRRDAARAGQRHADSLGNAHHRGRGAHRHAGTVAAGDAGFHLTPRLVTQAAGAAFVPVLEGVRTRAQHLAAPVAAQHRACGQEDAGDAHRKRTHQQARRGLVAAPHQHRAIHRVAAQQLFGFHRKEVAIEHGGGLDHAFRKRNRRQLQREPTGLQNPALHVFHTLLEVHVALIGVTPGIDDGDDRLAHPVGVRIAHLQHTRAVAKGAKVVRGKPAGAAEIGRLFASRLRVHGCRLRQVCVPAAPGIQVLGQRTPWALASASIRLASLKSFSLMPPASCVVSWMRTVS